MAVITGFRFATENERNAFVAGLDFADSDDLVVMLPEEPLDEEGFWPVFVLDDSEEPEIQPDEAEVFPTWKDGQATDLSFISRQDADEDDDWDDDEDDEDEAAGSAKP
jgi:hypothetical protein